MTLSAPAGAFRDLQHHDACGAGGDRRDTTPRTLTLNSTLTLTLALALTPTLTLALTPTLTLTLTLSRRDTTPGARCAAERRAGTHEAHGWTASAAG